MKKRNKYKDKKCGICGEIIFSDKQVCCGSISGGYTFCIKCCHHKPDPAFLNSGYFI